ncbi:MAG: LamG domain-containing protein [Clostridia bacterium]|nr:LamG domain-containing protein [Clostridia bacterium]
MKKIISIIIVLSMLAVMVSCGNTVTDQSTEATTVATTEAVTETTTEATTEATTEVATVATTEAVTEATTEATTVATTEATTEAEVPAKVDYDPAYVDIDFDGNEPSDASGEISFQKQGSVSISDGVLNVTAKSSGYICQWNNITSRNDALDFFGNGFTVEAYYLNREPDSVVVNNKVQSQGIICGTDAGGWGLAVANTDAGSGVPYFVIYHGNGYIYTYASSGASTTEYTHVLGVYDMVEMEVRLYVNGELQAVEFIAPGNYGVPTTEAYNKFCLGADIKKTTADDFCTTDFSMKDAKFYDYAVSDEQAMQIYADALETFGK